VLRWTWSLVASTVARAGRGGEAAAVQEDGRANPNQTLATEGNRSGLRDLIYALETAHVESFGSTDDLLVGLQLTHSGRFCKPSDHKRFEPRIAYHHPLLDSRVGISPEDDSRIWADDDLKRLIDRYVIAAEIASDCGYQFVDISADRRNPSTLGVGPFDFVDASGNLFHLEFPAGQFWKARNH